MANLKNKTLIITGASRGIGREIALRAAKDGANIVIAAKSANPHPKLEGTIFTVAEEVEKAGGKALPLQIDVRSEEQVQGMVEKTLSQFGGIDVLINNAGAISLTNTESTPIKKFDLMLSINTRAVYLCSHTCLPHLKKSSNPHILNLSPPLSYDPKWLYKHVAYTISKYGMSLCTIGMSKEFEEYGIAVNSLWPRTIIATAAIDMLMGDMGRPNSRKPEIMSDAAYLILTTEKRGITGQCLLDEDILKQHGVSDFSKYAYNPENQLLPDLYVEDPNYPWN